MLSLTPDTCPEGELFFEQSSELDEDVDVGVIETELLFPRKHKIYILLRSNYEKQGFDENDPPAYEHKWSVPHQTTPLFYSRSSVFFSLSGFLLSSWRAAEVPARLESNYCTIIFGFVTHGIIKLTTKFERGMACKIFDSPRVVLCRARMRYTLALPPRFCATKWSC